MISSVTPRARALLAASLAGLTAFSLSPRSGAAQPAPDSGWFEGSAPQAPGTPAPPAARPVQRMESLAPSPLLESEADSAVDRDPRALTAWNNELEPYGYWVDDATYGRVWIPHAKVVGSGFAPYVSGGHWALDENEDWIWVSDYPFGPVVFHYGRWVWIEGRGWAWIPGLQYAPAWVTWRVPTDYTYAYVGWAPLPPSYVWFGGVAVAWGFGWYYPWVFCPSAYVFSPYMYHYMVHDHAHMAWAANNTRPYHPASPRHGSSSSSSRAPAAPRAPSVDSARIPPSGVPQQRIAARNVAAAVPNGAGAAPPLRSDRAVRRASVDRREVARVASSDAKADLATRAQRAPERTPEVGSSPSFRQRETPRLEPSVRRERPSFDFSPRREPSLGPMRSPGRMSPGGFPGRRR